MPEVREWLAELRETAQPSPKITAVLDLIASQPRLASYAPVAEVAHRAQVNTATVVRAAQALGFKGWLAFRAEVRSRYLASLTAPEVSAEHSMKVERAAVAALRQDVANLAFLARSADVDLIDEFAAAIAGADQTMVVAAGSYTALAAPLAHLATAMGYPVSMETRGGAHLANALGLMSGRSCLVAVSFWRLHADTYRAARAARKRGAAVCVITDSATSPLTELASHVLVVSSESASWFPSLTAGVSAVNAILTALEEQGGQQVRDRIAEMDEMWHELDLYHRP